MRDLKYEACELSPEQLVTYQELSAKNRKSKFVAILLAIFFGGLGFHKFYQGRTLAGIMYLLFSWTLVPSIFALIDVFFIPGQIKFDNSQATLKAFMEIHSCAADKVQNVVELQKSNHALEIVLKIFFGVLFIWLVLVFSDVARDEVKFPMLHHIEISLVQHF